MKIRYKLNVDYESEWSEPHTYISTVIQPEFYMNRFDTLPVGYNTYLILLNSKGQCIRVNIDSCFFEVIN